MKPEKAHFWQLDNALKDNWLKKSWGRVHKDLRAIANKFDVIGHLKINPSAQCCGSQGGAVDFESFSYPFDNFNDFLGAKMTAKTRPMKVFAVQKSLQ